MKKNTMIILIDGASHLSLINDEVMKVNKSDYASRDKAKRN